MGFMYLSIHIRLAMYLFLAKLISRLKPKTIYGINRINKRVYIIIWKQTEKDIFRLDIIMFFTKIYSFGLSFHRTF